MPSHSSAVAHASRESLDAVKLAQLRRLLAEILPHNHFYARKLSRLADPARLESLAELTEWPFTFKEELGGTANEELPANLTWPLDRYVRYHQTSGTRGRPLPVFDTAADWDWWMECWRVILDRGGVGPGDRVFVAASFGPFAGFWSGFDAVVRAGAIAIPSGGVPTITRVEMIQRLGATVLLATPSYALHLAEAAAEARIDAAALPVRLVIVAGEPGGSAANVRRRLGEAWGADVLDHAGATEVGPWGVGAARDAENPGGLGLHVLEPWFHPEFLALETGEPAGDGEVAELVLTTLGRAGAPVIRYRTGDIVRPRWPSEREIAAGGCPWVWLDGGILGRTDDMLVVRGVNVFPRAIDEIVRGFPEVMEYRLKVAREGSLDTMLLEIEDRLSDPDRVARELRLRLGLRVDVKAVPAGSLPRFEGKGRRIHDLRPTGRTLAEA
jgi:phenylacetate-CoA ligase